jgi:hypothetical protein
MGFPRVLIVAARDLSGQLGGTALWRAGIERVFCADPAAALETLPNLGARLVVLDSDDAAAALRFVDCVRRDPLTRTLSIVVLDRALSLKDEDALRDAGANLVLSGRVDPGLWDARLEELLHVPRRREVRVPVLCEAWSEIRGGGAREGWALNLSVRGALLETEAPLDVGSSLDVKLQLPGLGSDVLAVARVVREAGASRGRCWSGIEFLILRGDGRERLQRFIGDAGQA